MPPTRYMLKSCHPYSYFLQTARKEEETRQFILLAICYAVVNSNAVFWKSKIILLNFLQKDNHYWKAVRDLWHVSIRLSWELSIVCTHLLLYTHTGWEDIPPQEGLPFPQRAGGMYWQIPCCGYGSQVPRVMHRVKQFTQLQLFGREYEMGDLEYHCMAYLSVFLLRYLFQSLILATGWIWNIDY